MDMTTLMIVAGGIVGYKLMDLVLTNWFKKVSNEDFVSKAECARCSRRGESATDDLRRQMVLVKKVVLAMAIKMGVNVEDIQELV